MGLIDKRLREGFSTGAAIPPALCQESLVLSTSSQISWGN